jgi:hypothetical protein
MGKSRVLIPASLMPGRRRRWFPRSRLLALAALLAQFQFAWLAGFHYHAELSAPHPRPALAAVPVHSGAPAEDSNSCLFCQTIRHSTSTPPGVVALCFHSISTVHRVPAIFLSPLTHSQIRLAGRDPPFSFVANN